jgi:MinD superfamily P-loop ATPase
MGEDRMKIAVLSGKGGTGKTFVSVNLAAAAPRAVYADCDVEEPNGHLFFKPQWQSDEVVSVKIPAADEKLCNGCRTCVDFCRFNALAYIKDKLIVFDDVCHSCGGCVLLCPEKAMTERDKVIGLVKKGISGNVTVLTGLLDTGQASGVPIIKRIMDSLADEGRLTVIDCPPGSSCVVMESIKGADYCVLVAEPTVFGVHNLGMVYELVRLFDKPLGVVLNKCVDDDNPAKRFCDDNQIEVLATIPYSEELATLNSKALIASVEKPDYLALFADMLKVMTGRMHHETAVNP